MKRSTLAVGSALALLGGLLFVPAQAASPPLEPGNSTGDDPDEEWWEGITFPTEGVLPDTEEHPSLYADASGVATLRDRVEGDAPDPHGHYAMAWDRLIEDAARYATEEVDESDDIKTKAAKATAFAWLITGEQQYLDTAVDNLELAFAEIVPTDQYVALQMTNYALAYDWVAADLSPEQDSAIRSAVKRGADWLYEYLDDEGVRSHNHRSKAGAALGSWALAFSVDPDAQAYLDRGLENLERVFSYMFTTDGIYRDGSGYYWVFTIINSTPFFWEYRNVSGVDLFPAMRPAFEWQLKTANPKGWTPPLDDGWYKPTWLHTVAGAYADTSTELSSDGTLGELFQWQFFASDLNPVRYPDDWTGARDQYYGWPEEIALYDSTIEEVQPDGTPTVDMDEGPRGGDTIFRSDWQYGEADTTWGYFSGVAMSNNHDHADGLQLLVEAENSILARDNGYGPQRFSGRDSWKQPEHHNVVTADGAAVGDPTPTRGFLDGSTFGFAEKSANYWDDQDASHTRAVAFPGSDYFVVLDQMEAATDKTWDAYWHARGDLTGVANRRTWTTSEGPWGDAAQLHALLVSDADLSLVEDQFNPYGTGVDTGFEGYPDPATDVEDTTGLQLEQTSQSADALSVLAPSAANSGDDPRLEDLRADDVLGARVTTADYTDVVAAPRSGETSASAAGLDVSGTLGWIRTEGGAPTGYAVHDGSSLVWDDRPLVEASAPVTLSADIAAAKEHVIEIAENDETYTLSLAASLGRPVADVEFDGSPLPFDVVDGQVVVELSGGGDLVVTYGAPSDRPATPGSLDGTAYDGAAVLTWAPVPSATSYEVHRSDGEVAEVSASTYTDTDVTNRRPYMYRVVAVNEAGKSKQSRPVTVVPRLRKPDAPEGLVVSAGHERVELGWLPVRDAGSYDVLRAEGDGELNRVADGLDTAEFVDTSVANGLTYRYAVRARNERGASKLSTEVTAAPVAQPPTTPSHVVVTRPDGNVMLNWDDAERAQTYTVLRGGLTADELDVVAEGIDESEWTDPSVEPNVGYTYRVVANNEAGASDPSQTVTGVGVCSATYSIDPETGAVVEAELFSARSGDYLVQDDGSRFGGQVAQVPDGSEYKEDPNLWGRYDFDIAEPGRYYVQVLGNGFDGSSDSVYVSVDNATPVTATLSVNDWFYRHSPIAVDLNEGFHTLLIKAREDGALVDRFVVYPADEIPDDVRYGPTWATPSDCP